MSELTSVALEIRAALGRRLHSHADVSRLALNDLQYSAFRDLQKEALVFGADFLATMSRREVAKDRFLDAALRFVATFAKPTPRKGRERQESVARLRAKNAELRRRIRLARDLDPRRPLPRARKARR